jgi:hypothetical protein
VGDLGPVHQPVDADDPSRRGPRVVLLIGSVISAPFARAGVPDDLGREQVVLIVVTAIGNTTGLLLVYGSQRFGKVGVVAPITSAQGAAAAVIAVAAGEQIATGAGVELGAIVVGWSCRACPERTRSMGRLSETSRSPGSSSVQDHRRVPRHGPARGHGAVAHDARSRTAGARLGPA